MTVGSDEQQAVYLAGAGSAIALMNAQGVAAGGPALYCPPGEFVLSAAEMRTLAATELTGRHEPQSFILAAISALRAKFPCG
jgi:hypothetical protein